MNQGTYAGNITPKQAWDMLSADPSTNLLDVRTTAEWSYVGIVDLSPLGRQSLLAPWKLFPDMRLNADFVSQVERFGIGKNTNLLIICRSGHRSQAAAAALTAAGFGACYNISYGFEGDKDASHHRGAVNGWQADGLPWAQG